MRQYASSKGTAVLIAVFFLLQNAMLAETPKYTQDSPAFKYDWDQSPAEAIKVRPGSITYLSYLGADTSEGVKFERRKVLGMYYGGDDWARWTVQAEKSHEFVIDVFGSVGRYGPKPHVIKIIGPKNTLTCRYRGRGKVEGTLKIPPGKSKIEVRAVKADNAHGASLMGLELIDAKDVEKIHKRVEAFRGDTRWMSDRTCGIMLQWGNWGYPRTGEKKKNWKDVYRDLDVEAFADKMKKMGAGWVVWSVTWRDQHLAAPVEAYEQIHPGFTMEYDFLGKLADALHKRDIKIIFYYHPGHENKDWWRVYRGDDRNTWYRNFAKVVSGIGRRYGKNLDGWMFDGGRKYYPAPYEILGLAAKDGNPDRLVSWNPWILPRVTDFQEFYFGEHYTGGKWKTDKHGIFTEGPHKGLLAHGNWPFAKSGWGIFRKNQKIAEPPMSKEEWIKKLKDARRQGIALSPCILMYEDGSISSDTYEYFTVARKSLRNQ